MNTNASKIERREMSSGVRGRREGRADRHYLCELYCLRSLSVSRYISSTMLIKLTVLTRANPLSSEASGDTLAFSMLKGPWMKEALFSITSCFSEFAYCGLCSRKESA